MAENFRADYIRAVKYFPFAAARHQNISGGCLIMRSLPVGGSRNPVSNPGGQLYCIGAVMLAAN